MRFVVGISLLLVAHVAPSQVETASDVARATAHYASFLFGTVASRLDKDLSEKNLTDDEESELLEEISIKIAKCQIDSLSVYGESTRLEAIRILAAGENVDALRPLIQRAVKASGGPGAVIGAMQQAQQTCIALVNQEYGVNYY